VFFSAVIIGDGESYNLSVFLASIGVLWFYPIFDSSVDWAEQSKFHKKWRAQQSIAFSGFVILLAAVIFDKLLKGGIALKLSLQTVVDFAALGISIAGAVSAYDKNPNNNYEKKKDNYIISYTVVITILNFFAGLFGHDGIPLITTFFASVVLTYYDNGSTSGTYKGYARGGLQLCALGTLVSIFFKVFSVAQIQEGFFPKVIDDKNVRTAAFFALAWATVSAIYVPNNYSLYLLIAIITFGALTHKCPNWAKTTFFIVAYWGIVQQFPLAVNISFTYVKAIIFIASVAFAKIYYQDFGAAAAPGFGPTSDDPAKEVTSEPSA